MTINTRIAAIMLAFGDAVTIGSLTAATTVSAAPALQQQATFAIENMTCALCPVTVKKAMSGVAGVDQVAIDFKAKTATVRFDPKRTSLAAIAKASTNAGYPARVSKG